MKKNFLVGLILVLTIFLYFQSKNLHQVTYKKRKVKQKIILNKIEEIAKYLKIDIILIKFQAKFVLISIYGDYKKVFNFLNLIEKASKITSIEFKYNKKLLINLKLIKNSFRAINFKNIELLNLPNPFILKNKKENNQKAIIGDFVYYKGKWLKVGDKIQESKIIKITPNSLILKNKAIRLFNED